MIPMWPVKMQNRFGVTAYLEHRYVMEPIAEALRAAMAF
jgi:hypothetical protein